METWVSFWRRADAGTITLTDGQAWHGRSTESLLTLPQLMGVVRYESDDDSNLLSYTLAGIGLSADFLNPNGNT